MEHVIQRGSHESDRRLVARAAAGDSEAWAALVERYSRYVYSLLSSARVPEREQADAFQYVFVELFKAIGSLRNVENLAPWIRQTALRHAVRLRQRLERVLPSSGEPEFELLSADTDLEALVIAADQAERIRALVRGLPPRCQTLILRLFFEHPPRAYEEVAVELGLKIGSIGMTRQRCLDMLEARMIEAGLP